jgi:hypothetical protein
MILASPIPPRQAARYDGRVAKDYDFKSSGGTFTTGISRPHRGHGRLGEGRRPKSNGRGRLLLNALDHAGSTREIHAP